MSLCMGCMQEIGDQPVCPECGFKATEKQPEPFLGFNTILKNRYIVGRGIDTNGESTRYLGYDKVTYKTVIIREFLPIGLFDRAAGETDLVVGYNNETVFKNLKENFISYYKIVQELNEMSVMIEILDIFEENNTAYVVEENLDLVTFDEFLKRSNGQLEWETARVLFMPVISALESLHKRGVGHYAVSPSNILVTKDGKLKLTGFSTSMERKRGTPLKSQLYSGCAAPEQYEKNFTLDVLTEIYGFTATLFHTLTGHVPANANERLKDSSLLMSTSTVKRLPPHVVTALANGLQVNRKDRISDFDELRSQLSVAPTAQAIQEEISKTASLADLGNQEEDQDKKPAKITLISAIISLVVFAALGVTLIVTDCFGLLGDSTGGIKDTSSTAAWSGPTVDNFVGMKYSSVKKQLNGSDKYEVNITYEDVFNDKVAEGYICEQIPPAGTPITSKDEAVNIVLTISKGAKMRTLPDISGKNIKSAADLLSEAGVLVMQEAEYNTKYPDGTVIDYKSLKSGDQIEYGKTVVIRVSMGEEPTTVGKVNN